MNYHKLEYGFLRDMENIVEEMRDMFFVAAEDETHISLDEADSLIDAFEAWRDISGAVRDMKKTYEATKRFMEAWEYIQTYAPRFAEYMTKELDKRPY